MLDIILKILVIFSIITFTFIGIWSFVLLNSFYSQFRYRNYLLEKISHNIHTLSHNFKKLYDKEDGSLEINSDLKN
jgi:hypothetical protein